MREQVGVLLSRRHLSSELALEVGVRLAQHELYDQAALVFDRCAKDYPQLFEAHYDLALAELALQQYSAAQAALAAARPATRREQTAQQYLRGKILAAEGQFDQAEPELSEAFKRLPSEEDYALDLGMLYLKQQAYRRAEQVFQRAVHYHARSPHLILGIALSEFLGGDNDAAIETARRLIKIAPDFPLARLMAAFALDMGGNLAEAEHVAATGLHESSPDPLLQYLHASILLKLQSRDYETMLRELTAAEQKMPTCALCYLVQSKVHQEAGDTAAAIDNLETAVRLEPTFADAWYRLARLFEQNGRQADADDAKAHFTALKTEKFSRENDLIRRLWLQAVQGGTAVPAN